jgi:hypothetical protein
VVENGEWAFANLRMITQADALLVYGEMLNDTGVSQEMDVISGLFYDSQGQVIADDRDMEGSWPIEVVPPAGRVPFELVVGGAQGFASFDLNVEANPTEATPRQDFEFLDLSQSNDGGSYCVAGQLRNPGPGLNDYLIIVAVLYDNTDQVIGYGHHNEPFPNEAKGDQTLDFKVCTNTPDLPVARYEVRAWGE